MNNRSSHGFSSCSNSSSNRGSVIVALDNPKNVSNVGSVIRASHCFQADKIVYSGTRYDRAARFNTDTQDAATKLPFQHTDNIFALVPEGFRIVCIELAVGAIPLPDFTHPYDAVYLFGPEDGSLSQSTVNKADDVVFIPATSSLNLAASVNVVLYDRQAKKTPRLNPEEYDDLIRQSRDCRNRLSTNGKHP